MPGLGGGAVVGCMIGRFRVGVRGGFCRLLGDWFSFALGDGLLALDGQGALLSVLVVGVYGGWSVLGGSGRG